MYATRKPNWRGWGGLAPTPQWGGRAGRVARTIAAGGLGAFLADDAEDAAWAAQFAALKRQHAAVLSRAAALATVPAPTPTGVAAQAHKAARQLTKRVVPTATTLPLSPTVMDIAVSETARRAEQAAADRAAAAPLTVFGLSPMLLIAGAGLVVGVLALRGWRRGR